MFSVFAETGGRCGSVHEKLRARPGACLIPKGHATSLGPSRRLTSLAAAHEKRRVDPPGTYSVSRGIRHVAEQTPRRTTTRSGARIRRAHIRSRGGYAMSRTPEQTPRSDTRTAGKSGHGLASNRADCPRQTSCGTTSRSRTPSGTTWAVRAAAGRRRARDGHCGFKRKYHRGAKRGSASRTRPRCYTRARLLLAARDLAARGLQTQTRRAASEGLSTARGSPAIR